MEEVEQLEREGLIVGSASVEQALEHIVLVACIAIEELVPVQNEHSLESIIPIITRVIQISRLRLVVARASTLSSKVSQLLTLVTSKFRFVKTNFCITGQSWKFPS